MPSFLKVLILAALQGFTEFLPISSSGHLVLAKRLLDLHSPGAVLEIALHGGTLVSILLYYRKRILTLCLELFTDGGEGRRYAVAIVVASLPAFIVYVTLGEKIESVFEQPRIVGSMLLVTGAVLMSMLVKPRRSRDLGILPALCMGCAQALSLLPGISRAGTTIAAGYHLGLQPKRAAEFSLLMSVPALVAAVAINFPRVREGGLGDITAVQILAGMAVAAAVGYLAIVCLVKMLEAGKLWLFGPYCIVAGAIAWLLA